MTTYIMLANYTEQGIKTADKIPGRIDTSRARARELGGEIKLVFLTMGIYDVVIVADFPDAEAMAKFAFILGAGGNLRTTTLPAFSEDQYRAIVTSLPS